MTKNNKSNINDLCKRIIFNNLVIRKQIFENIKNITLIINRDEGYRWIDVVDNINILASYRYKKEILEYFENVNKCFFKHINIIDQVNVVLISYLKLDIDSFKDMFNHLSIIFKDIDFSFKILKPTRILEAAVRSNRFDIFKFIIDSYVSSGFSAEYFFDSQSQFGKSLSRALLKSVEMSSCSIEFLEYLIVQKIGIYTRAYQESSNYLITNAFLYDRLDVFKWLEEQDDRIIKKDYCFSKVLSGATTFEVIKYLHNCGRLSKFLPLEIQSLVEMNNLGLLRLIFDMKIIELPKRITCLILVDLEILKFLQSKNITVRLYCYAHFFTDKDLYYLEWIHRNGKSVFVNWDCLFKYALRDNQFKVIQWLQENRSQLFYKVKPLAYCAASGNVEIFKWIYTYYSDRYRNQDIGDKVLNNAVESGNIELVQWIYDQFPGVNINNVTFESFSVAAKDGRLEIIQWLFRHGYRVDEYHANILYVMITDADWEIESVFMVFKYLLEKFNEHIAVDMNSIKALCIASCQYRLSNLFQLIHGTFIDHIDREFACELLSEGMEKSLEIVIYLDQHYNFTSNEFQLNRLTNNREFFILEILQYVISNKSIIIDNSFLIESITCGCFHIGVWLLETHFHLFDTSTLVGYPFFKHSFSYGFDRPELLNFLQDKQDTIKQLKILHFKNLFSN